MAIDKRWLRLARLTAATTALVALTTMTACSSTSSAEPSTSGDGGGNVVKSLVAGAGLSFADELYTRAAGYYEAEGLTMEYLASPESSATAVNLVVQGDADLAFVGPGPAYAAIAQKRDIKLYATSMAGVATGIVVTEETADKLANAGITPDSPLKDRVAALKGLTIAGEGAGTSAYTIFLSILHDAGLKPTDVVYQTVQNWADGANAARQGRVDAYIAPSPELALGPAEGWGTLLLEYSEVPDFHEIPWIEVVANGDFVREHPEQMKSVLTALWKTVADFRDQPEKVAQTLKETVDFKSMDNALFQKAFDYVVPTFNSTIDPSESGFMVNLDLYNQVAQTPAKLTFDDVYDVALVKETAPAKGTAG